MTHKIECALPAGEFLAAIGENCVKLGSIQARAKNARACQIKGDRVKMTQNGPSGRTYPYQVFSGKVAQGPDSGAVVTGSFSLALSFKIFLAVIFAAVALMCVFGSWKLGLVPKIVIYASGGFCCAVLVVFSAVISKSFGTENQARLLAFLADPVCGREEPEPGEVE